MASHRFATWYLMTALGLFLQAGDVFAQTSPDSARLFFDHIGVEQGLVGKAITALYRDRRGFLWIGTANGLNEYDGVRVNTFRHLRSDSSSLVNNAINSIVEDENGHLWVGTNGGISEFNPYDHKSVNYRHHPSDPYSLNSNNKCRVYIDREHTLWVGNDLGLSFFDKKTRRFHPVAILPDSLNTRTLTEVSAFLEDREGRFWLGTYSGLVLYDRKRHTSKRYILNKGLSVDLNPVNTLTQDHAGHIWVGIWGSGLSEFNPATGAFSPYKWNHRPVFTGSVNIPFALAETRSGDGRYILWAGTSEGLLRIDSLPLNDRSVAHFVRDPTDAHSLSSNQVSCLYTDRRNILWVGTGNGLNEYVLRNQAFSDQIPLKGTVSRIWVDSMQRPVHYFVAAWYGNGLTELDQHFKVIHTWPKMPPGAKNQDNSQISDVIRASDGTLWVATFNGLCHYDPGAKRFTIYHHLKGVDNSLGADQLTCVQEGPDGSIYIGTYGRGVDRYDPARNRFVHYRHRKGDSTSLNDNLVWSFYRDREQQLWIATDRGYSLLEQQNGRFTNFVPRDGDAGSIRGTSPAGIIQGKGRVYWMATDKGLNRLDLDKRQFTLFDEESGLKDNSITAVMADREGDLWLCTASGVSSFNPETGTFVNYNEQNGLPRNRQYGAIARDANGDILLGGDDMLVRFDPTDFKKTSAAPPVYITVLSFAGRSMVFHRPIRPTEKITLPYPVNDFSATFSAPEFLNGKAVRYAYRLEGLDRDWVRAGTRNFVSYANLAPGDYTLFVSATGSDGARNKKGASLRISVLPPLWKTWWFRVCVLLAVTLAVYSLFIFRVRRIRREETRKTAVNKQMADMRLKALRSRMNPHFMFNALNSIQECIYTGDSNSAYRYLSKFSRLVRLILERSENMFISLSEEIEMLELYLELESLRFQHSFTYHIVHEGIETDFLKIPPMLIQPFVENALWHGLLHKNGAKILTVSFRCDDRFIYTEIRDNGIGRKASKAFRKTSSHKKQSLGIQLATEQLATVGRIGGSPADIRVEDLFGDDTGESADRQPAGTLVVLTIPILHDGT